MLNPNIVGVAKAIDGRALKLFKRGTHRTTAPDETLARFAPLARQIGITRIGNVTGLDHIGIPVAIAVRPNSRSFSVSQGKGLNLSQAHASALMEAIELFHGEDIAARTRVASHREISADSCVVEPGTLCGTGTPLPVGTKIAWIEGYDMLCRESCWVQWEIVHTDYTLPTSHSGRHFLSGTNGIAAGNHMLEALSAAVCELIEHDAVALWHAGRLQERARRRVDIASIDDEDCCTLLDKYQRAGVAPRVWDVTSDIRISTFVCDIPATGDDRFGALRRFRGAGCHPNRAIALARVDRSCASDYEESQHEKIGAALLDAVSQDSEPRAFCHIPNFDAARS